MDLVFAVALVLGLVAVVMITAAAVLRIRTDVTTRLGGIERSLSEIRGHLGVPHAEPETADIVAELDRGRDAEAVRLYRRRTGADLVEAKAAVDELDRRRREDRPE